jgi:hypothetical protein
MATICWLQEGHCLEKVLRVIAGITVSGFIYTRECMTILQHLFGLCIRFFHSCSDRRTLQNAASICSCNDCSFIFVRSESGFTLTFLYFIVTD